MKRKALILLILMELCGTTFSQIISVYYHPYDAPDDYDDDYPEWRFRYRHRHRVLPNLLQPPTECELLAKGTTPHERHNLTTVLLWNSDLARAAAALLRATLIAAKYNGDLITLHDHDSMRPTTIDSHTLVVEVTLAAQLQVRLTPRAARSSACKNVSSWSFYQDTNALSHCDFIVPRKNKKSHTMIFILDEWDGMCAAENIRYSLSNTSSTRYHLSYLDRTYLTYLVRNSNSSFLFLDNYQWTDSNTVQIVQTPPESSNDTCSLAHEKTVSLKVTNGLLPDKFIDFTPSLSDLHKIVDNYFDINNAACKLTSRNEFQDMQKWQKSAVIKTNPNSAVVIICKAQVDDLDFTEYVYMTGMLDDNNTITINSTMFAKNRILFKVFLIDCTDTDWLFRKLINWFSKTEISQIAGVIATDDIAAAAAPLATKFELPLLTYDVASDSSLFSPARAVRSATGSVKHLELALRRLLADCSWQRLAIISESTRLAKALSAALQIPTTGLTVREVNVTSSSDIQTRLQDLLDANTRVFLVNTGAAMAAAVIAEAHKLNMTRDQDFTWIVREYNAADNATSVIKPYSVSFWWRGEREKEKSNKEEKMVKIGNVNDSYPSVKDDVVLRMKLEENWRGRAWPLYAAPLLDALITLGEGVRRDIHQKWSGLTLDGKLSSFWSDIEKEHIPGFNQNLAYDEVGVKAPLVFVQQWGAESRPRLLATWRGGEWRESLENCPTNDQSPDGTTTCLLPSGDPFDPICHDVIWIPSIILGVLVGTASITVAIRWLYRAFSIRDLRIKTEFAKRLLARRERVFAALAEHLVERSALDLFQELGTGRFGRVHLGMLRESGRKNHNVVVAAKSLREEASSAEESEFLKEACTLAALNHEHVIRFVGVCVVDGPPLLLMEHAFFGDLLHYLQARRCLADKPKQVEAVTNCFEMDEKAYVSAKALTKLAQEAASALAYLAERGIVHRDLRASNCLVDDRRCLKLADFGLARATGTIDGEYACRRGLFPVLWMAPESLAKGVSSAASDVWSFGVLVFELVTLGRRPYGVQPPPTVLRHVLAGGRPQLPWDASSETRALTGACWRREPEARPTAEQLVDWLRTRWRALRPALVTELVDIDSDVYGVNNTGEFVLFTPPNEALKNQQSGPKTNNIRQQRI